MDAKVTWKYGLSFDGIADSGFTIPLGTSSAHGGADDGLAPMELLLIGLGGCTGMDVISILQKKRQQVTAFEIRVHGERAVDHPKVFTNIIIEYVVTGKGIEREAVERAVELSETKYCSVNATLNKTAHVETKITILEG